MSLHGREDFEGFVYLDIDHPMVAWNTARGVYCSVDCLEKSEANSAISLSMANMLRGYAEDRLKSEMAIEAVRQEFFPDHVSRLTGVFVFDDIDSISSLWYSEEWGNHFNDKYMTDVGVSANKSSRVDANWIPEIMDEHGNLKAGWMDCTHKYWQGLAHPTKNPIWERIVSGWITIWGTEIKTNAIKEISKYWPKSLKLLEYSCNASIVNSNDGISFALATKEGDNIHIEFYLRLVDAQTESIFKKMELHFKENPQKRAIYSGDSTLNTPDLSHLKLKIPAPEPVSFMIGSDGKVETNLQNPIK